MYTKGRFPSHRQIKGLPRLSKWGEIPRLHPIHRKETWRVLYLHRTECQCCAHHQDKRRQKEGHQVSAADRVGKQKQLDGCHAPDYPTSSIVTLSLSGHRAVELHTQPRKGRKINDESGTSNTASSKQEPTHSSRIHVKFVPSSKSGRYRRHERRYTERRMVDEREERPSKLHSKYNTIMSKRQAPVPGGKVAGNTFLSYLWQKQKHSLSAPSSCVPGVELCYTTPALYCTAVVVQQVPAIGPPKSTSPLRPKS